MANHGYGRVLTLAVVCWIVEPNTGMPEPHQAIRAVTAVGSITGQVIRADTGHPVRHAHVTLVSSGRSELAANADESGIFLFAHVPEGRYWLRAERDHWVPAYLGQKDVGDSPKSIVLAQGQNISGLRISLFRLGVIAGRVLDKYSEGVEGVRYLWTAVVTNGRYEFPALPPGSYTVWHEPPRRIGEISRPEYLERVMQRGQTVQLGEQGVTELPVYCS